MQCQLFADGHIEFIQVVKDMIAKWCIDALIGDLYFILYSPFIFVM